MVGDKKFIVVITPRNSQLRESAVTLTVYGANKIRAIAQAKAQLRTTGRNPNLYSFRVSVSNPPSEKQLAARAKFVEMAKTRTAKSNPVRKGLRRVKRQAHRVATGKTSFLESVKAGTRIKKRIKARKALARKQNKTIITKPKRVTVLNPRKLAIPTRYKWSPYGTGGYRWVMEYEPYGDGDLHNYIREYPNLSAVIQDLRDKFGGSFANKIQKEIQAKNNPTKSVRRKYDKGSIASAVDAARKVVHARPLYVFGTYSGFSISESKPPSSQSYVKVMPDGSTEKGGYESPSDSFLDRPLKRRRNKTIITKLNPATLKTLYAKRAEMERQEENCGVGREGDYKRKAIREKLAILGDKIYKAEMEGRERARKAWQKNPTKSTRRKYRNGSYTVEAIPKYTSTVKEDVQALTRGSAIRKVQRKVEGPKTAYRYRVEKNPVGKIVRRKVRNGYMDMVIAGHATQVQQGNRTGWTVRGGGAKSRRKGAGFFPVGKGIVPISRSGYYLDKATGAVFSKKARNIAQGFYDAHGFHPIRASADYIPALAGEGSDVIDAHRKKKPAKKTASKKRRNVATGAYYGGSFHPFRSSDDYDPSRAGETGKKPIRTRSKAKKAAVRKAIRTASDKAETRKRKSTTSRLASRSLSRSVSLKAGSRSKNPRQQSVYIQTGIKQAKEGLREGVSVANIKHTLKHLAYTEAEIRKIFAAINKAKRNPSVKEIRKTFAGTVGKTQPVFAPIGTPKNVAKLGTLKLIDTETAKITPRGTVYLCADTKGKLHIVGSKNAPIYEGPAQSFGKISLIEYDAAKPHLYPGQGTIRFWHKLGEESGNKPTLIGDGQGGLKIKGGSYSITREGIKD